MDALVLAGILGALGVVSVIGLVRRGAAATPRPKILARIAVTPVAELAEGVVRRVIGEVSLADERKLVAPISGLDCVLYRTVVSELVTEGSTTQAVPIATFADTVDFVVTDASGSVRVEGQDADFFGEPIKGASGFLKDPPGSLKEALADIGESAETKLGLNRTLIWEELVLQPGDQATVFGGVRRGAHSAVPNTAGYRDARAFVMGRLRRGPVIVSNDPRATQKPSTHVPKV